jgi:lipoyl-dependent peroxiredoxin
VVVESGELAGSRLRGVVQVGGQHPGRLLRPHLGAGDGPLRAGSGQLEFVSSGIGTYPVTWASRVERPDGRTSPEELLAASHATCYAMALNATLSAGRHEPQRLDVTAKVSLDPKEGGGLRISSSELIAKGVVQGLDQAGFQEAADQAEQACPISNALRNNVEITVKATLES